MTEIGGVMEMNSGTTARGSTTKKMVTRLERKNDIIVQGQNGNLPLVAQPPDRSQPLLSIESPPLGGRPNVTVAGGDVTQHRRMVKVVALVFLARNRHVTSASDDRVRTGQFPQETAALSAAISALPASSWSQRLRSFRQNQSARLYVD